MREGGRKEGEWEVRAQREGARKGADGTVPDAGRDRGSKGRKDVGGGRTGAGRIASAREERKICEIAEKYEIATIYYNLKHAFNFYCNLIHVFVLLKRLVFQFDYCIMCL